MRCWSNLVDTDYRCTIFMTEAVKYIGKGQKVA